MSAEPDHQFLPLHSFDLMDARLVGLTRLWNLGLGGVLAALSFADVQARQKGAAAARGPGPARLAAGWTTR